MEHGKPGDTVFDVTPDFDRSWELNPGPYGAGPDDGEWVTRPKTLSYGRGRGNSVVAYDGDFWDPEFKPGASCDEIRDCLDKFVPSEGYIFGLSDCRAMIDVALAACGLKRIE
jgi:hypothetical protein